MSSKTLRMLNAFERALLSDNGERHLQMLIRLSSRFLPIIPSLSKIHGLARNRDWKGLIEEADSLVSQKYETATLHFVANQIAALIRKLEDDFGLEPELTARLRFSQEYSRLRAFEQRFSAIRLEHSEPLNRARGAMAFLLSTGDVDMYGFPCIDHNRWMDRCDFPAGASLGVHGNATHVGRKIDSELTVSSRALDYAWRAITRNFHLLSRFLPRKGDFFCYDYDEARKNFINSVRIRDDNKMAFVPKTAKTHRVIAVEPTLNGYLQKGVDRLLRALLYRKTGIDLSDQTGNSKLAREGSLGGEDPYVTIDLSSASDSVTEVLCKEILPAEWYRLLSSIRSHQTEIDGRKVRLPSFATMGNGFCFPLETLVFCAFAMASGAKIGDFRVYGDDIIVRQSIAGPLISFLHSMGFEVNKKKTFLEGPFRESCGTDYFEGTDVRPYTQNSLFRKIEDIFVFLNQTNSGLRLWFFEEERGNVLNMIPPPLRFVVPHDDPSDSGIQLHYSERVRSDLTFYSKKLQKCVGPALRHRGRVDLRPYSEEAVVYAGLRFSARFTFRRETARSITLR
jgi:hypothetical protein